MAKGGNPRRKIDIAHAERLAERGLTNEQIAHSLGMGRTTFQLRKRESEQLEQALMRGRARSIAIISDKFFEIIVAKDGDEYRFDDDTRLNAMKFFLERRGGWTKESKVVTSSETEQQMQITIELVERAEGK